MADGSSEVAVLFTRWLDRTVELHLQELQKRGIGETDELRRSVTKHYRMLGEGYLEGGLMFLERGRFVDMGSGRGYSFGQSTRGNWGDAESPRRGSGRKANPWYSKVFYARINDLQGAVGFKLMEQSIDQVKEANLG